MSYEAQSRKYRVALSGLVARAPTGVDEPS